MCFLIKNTLPKYFAGTARSPKLNSKGIPCDLLVWWLCRNGPLLPGLFASGKKLCRVFANHMLECTAPDMCWAGLQNPCVHKNLLSALCLHPLPFESPSAKRLDSCDRVSKHFKQPCQFPASLHPKNKMFCLVILFSAGTQTNDCGFQFVWTSSLLNGSVV